VLAIAEARGAAQIGRCALFLRKLQELYPCESGEFLNQAARAVDDPVFRILDAVLES
jgi:hypothetical protein